jgi:hypothetical protein
MKLQNDLWELESHAILIKGKIIFIIHKTPYKIFVFVRDIDDYMI